MKKSHVGVWDGSFGWGKEICTGEAPKITLSTTFFCGISQICALVGSFRGDKTVSTTTGSSVVLSGLSFFDKAPKMDVWGDSGSESDEIWDKIGSHGALSAIFFLEKSLSGILGDPSGDNAEICTKTGSGVTFSAIPGVWEP